MAKRKNHVSEIDKIEAHFNTEDDLFNGIAFKVYTEAKNENVFVNLETPLSIFSQLVIKAYDNISKPIQALDKLKTILFEQKINNEQKYFILRYFENYLRNRVNLYETGNNEIKLNQLISLISDENSAIKREIESVSLSNILKSELAFDWDKALTQLEKIPDIKERIKYLIELKTQASQAEYQVTKSPNFVINCHLEIVKLKAIQKLERSSKTPTKSFILKETKGVKINLIRILNAMYELKYFELPDGQIPSKEFFMRTVGEFFGTDLSKYDVDLSQALNNTTMEANLKVFEDLKNITSQGHYLSKKVK